eukprot:6201872-Pleurochrysis_carterae.AAC.4
MKTQIPSANDSTAIWYCDTLKKTAAGCSIRSRSLSRTVSSAARRARLRPSFNRAYNNGITSSDCMFASAPPLSAPRAAVTSHVTHYQFARSLLVAW